MHGDDTVPDVEEADAAFLEVIVGVVENPPALLACGHGGVVGEAVVAWAGVRGFGAEELVVATVGWDDLVVVLFLVDGERFVEDEEVGVGTTTGTALETKVV